MEYILTIHQRVMSVIGITHTVRKSGIMASESGRGLSHTMMHRNG